MIHSWLPIDFNLYTIRNRSSRNGQFEIHLRPETRRIALAANPFPNGSASVHQGHYVIPARRELRERSP